MSLILFTRGDPKTGEFKEEYVHMRHFDSHHANPDGEGSILVFARPNAFHLIEQWYETMESSVDDSPNAPSRAVQIGRMATARANLNKCKTGEIDIGAPRLENIHVLEDPDEVTWRIQMCAVQEARDERLESFPMPNRTIEQEKNYMRDHIRDGIRRRLKAQFRAPG